MYKERGIVAKDYDRIAFVSLSVAQFLKTAAKNDPGFPWGAMAMFLSWALRRDAYAPESVWKECPAVRELDHAIAMRDYNYVLRIMEDIGWWTASRLIKMEGK